MIMRSIEEKGGIIIGDNVINNLKYADDTLVIAETETELRQLMDIVVQENEIRGLYLMKSACNITVNEIRLYHLFIYLGSLFTSDGICEQDVRLRIGITKSTFISMEKFLKARNIDLQLCYVWATLLYGCETWTLSGDMMKQLEAVEPSNGVPIFRFLTSRLCRQTRWMAGAAPQKSR